MLSHKALSVGNLKGDRERQKKKWKMLFREEKSLDKYDEKPFIQQVLKLKNSFSVCQSAFVCTVTSEEY